MKKILSIVAMLTAAVAMHAFDGTKYYVINRNGNTNAYMYADGTSLKTGTLNASDASYIWQLIPTETADGYYLKNVGTEQYVQTSKIAVSSNVSMGDSQVEYIVSTGAGSTGTGTTYFLASNDQGTIDYTTDATLGLNFGSTGVVAYYIKTGRGNSYWNITETEYSPSPTPEPIEGEDADVCKNVKAYRLPCGTYKSATKLTQIGISGEGVLSSLSFAPTTTSRYTIYTKDRAVVMPGKVDVKATLTGATTSGLVVSVYGDFDGDGQFEQSVQPTVAADFSAQLTVPSGAKASMGRIRIRVDQSGNISPNGDVTGTIYDMPIYVKEAKTTRTLTVKANGADRGTVSIEGKEGTTADYAVGTEVKVTAQKADGYKFAGWKLGSTIVSSDKTYTVTMDEDKTLVAMFTPKSGGSYGIEGQYIVLTFERGSSDITVNVADQDDEKVAGVTAEYTGAFKKSGWTGAAVADKTDISAATGAVGTERKFPFTITGLASDYYIDKIYAQIAAVTSTGAYQGTTVVREFSYTVSTGASSDDLTEFGTTSGDIYKNVGQKTIWEMAGAKSISPSDPLYVNLVLVNNATQTCYSALYALILHKGEAPTGVDEVSGSKFQVADSQLYDMSGRKVNAVGHGVYVKDGKKVIR